VTFFAILSVGYIYVWRKGVLDWGAAAPRVRRPTSRKAA
jgi:hypothetical protein